jgi:hypothetical protein
MVSNYKRQLGLALTLAALAVPYGRAIGQSTAPISPGVVTGTNPEPQVVTGTNPEPQMIAIILLSMIPTA